MENENHIKPYKKRKPKGYVKRTEEQRMYDMAFCANLFLRAYSYREIANALNADIKKRGADYEITFQMVYYDMQKLLIEWKRERIDTIDEYITQELRKLDKMEVELWNAWEVSKGGKVREKKRTSSKSRKVLTEDEKASDWYGYNETMNETSSGNPRYFDLLLNVQQRRAKLLGYDAPVKVEMQGVNIHESDEKEKYNINGLPDELLYAVVDNIQNAKYIEEMRAKGNVQ